MKTRQKIHALGLALTVFLMVSGLFAAEGKGPKYVFLMIGDGMGRGQRDIGNLYETGRLKAAGKAADAPALCMEMLPVKGEAKTYSASSEITDSAAAGTALATGFKTNNGVIGLNADEDLGNPLPSLADIAIKQGKKAGVLTNVSINDATPSVFYAHARARNMSYDIAMQLANSKLTFAGGGGISSNKDDKDKEDPCEAAKKKGFTFVSKRDELLALKPGARALVLAPDLWSRDINRNPEKQYLTLAEATAKAIELLDSENGFFLMVEGGDIDHDSHVNDLGSLARQVKVFDDAVRVAWEFCQKHPADSLIVVAADHETGGLDATKAKDIYARLSRQNSTQGTFLNATKELVDKKSGFAEVVPLLEKYFGLENLTPEEKTQLSDAWAMTIDKEFKKEEFAKVYSSKSAIGVCASRALSKRAGVEWGRLGHTNANVPVTAAGAGSEAFAGVQENTNIPRAIAKLWGVEIPGLGSAEIKPKKSTASKDKD